MAHDLDAPIWDFAVPTGPAVPGMRRMSDE